MLKQYIFFLNVQGDGTKKTDFLIIIINKIIHLKKDNQFKKYIFFTVNKLNSNRSCV